MATLAEPPTMGGPAAPGRAPPELIDAEMRDNGGPVPKAPKAANDGFTLVTRRTIRCPALRPGPDNGRVILGNNENNKYLVKVPKHKIVNGATGIVMKMLADAMDMQRIPYRDLRRCPGQIGDFAKFTFSLAVMPPDTIEVKGLGTMLWAR
ncbi:hypothetical protein BCR44DRAFT_1460252 [Catenaria anguillulae PL171]|uniref:Uncharacterized protein n=1 Tax=Catenaria anguillulae PL171 TaxID=765915 RepID=A0A1Y2HRZ9_9FUNG|nr:hypothetical protein BCR44DRAFT_1460252 [Catenaria anguillulae PL171]